MFFPPEYSSTINPEIYKLTENDLIENKNGIFTLTMPIYAKGVDRLFMDVVKDMMEIVFVAAPRTLKYSLDWSVQFVNPKALEDLYVSRLFSDTSDEDLRVMKPTLREEYLRNRFRSYMQRIQLFTSAEEKLELQATLEDSAVVIHTITTESTRAPIKP